ncbi:uncharacterized protein LOC110710381 isoform X2 [Chenopodium quinoa]|uniref:uncharacterized protein LOC110710381 isoform X2 n=1 Tax=Chenopodium quinoa TaxID=63459 RepID=UPI000B7902B6|nr:uncharacterized protein LOC110710381 isoform X2 [Chenopodium quinoa]
MTCNDEFDDEDLEFDEDLKYDEEVTDKSESDPEYDVALEEDKGEPEDIAAEKLGQMLDDFERMADTASLNDSKVTTTTPSTAANTTHQVVTTGKKGIGSGRGRGSGKARFPTRGLRVNEPMHLEFDEFLRPTGKWRLKYGQQIGLCMRKLNINWEWCSVKKGLKTTLWQETQIAL